MSCAFDPIVSMVTLHEFDDHCGISVVSLTTIVRYVNLMTIVSMVTVSDLDNWFHSYSMLPRQLHDSMVTVC